MSLTEDDVRRIIAEHSANRGIQPETVQWLVRSAYEEGWRSGGGDPSTSHHAGPATGWRKAWLESSARGILVRNGMISGKDSYK